MNGKRGRFYQRQRPNGLNHRFFATYLFLQVLKRASPFKLIERISQIKII